MKRFVEGWIGGRARCFRTGWTTGPTRTIRFVRSMPLSMRFISPNSGSTGLRQRRRGGLVLEADCWHNQEVHGGDAGRMITEKGPPRL
jgi:hypothetical protein